MTPQAMSAAGTNASAVDLGIPADHPAYAGHFPGMPILPGVVLLDAALRRLEEAGRIDPAHCEVAAFKFVSPVRPSDRPTLAYEALANGAIRITIAVAGRTVAAGIARSRPGADPG